LIDVLKAFFVPKIYIPVILMECYVLVEVLILKELGCWNVSLIKDTIYWFLLSAFVLFMNIVTEKSPKMFFKKALIQLFGVMVIIQYLLNIYTFPLIGELILTPVLMFVVCAIAIAENDKKLAPTKKFFEILQTLIMSVVMYYAIRNIWSHRTELFENQKIVSFSLPILLTLMYFPFLYLAKLITSYESLFVRLTINMSDEKKLQAFARRKTLLLCHLNLFKLYRLEKIMPLNVCLSTDRKEFSSFIKDFKTGELK
jgi:hypothetical protein